MSVLVGCVFGANVDNKGVLLIFLFQLW